ncbi:catabolite control protein A [Capsulimonas corticalis]|uniref:Catabolite control protein A n=1 Tax=Capsulimonas corticalis TaxID=2219043 RepID=A0A402D320_9BACT|nr:LacI family DNA-binding transcriptional regulator [Capsulimonas corticalis]BDI28366.1 catabolite control protein A [Capsulimonas corticalis]
MITIKDIARTANVGVTTVSRVINNHPRVDPVTRERILQCMRDLNYYPSALARNLSRSQMNVIGIVFPEGVLVIWGANNYFAPTLNGVAAAANELHQSVLLCSNDVWSNVPNSFSSLLDRRCDGLLLFGMPRENDLTPVLLRSGFPFVMVSDMSEDKRVASVDIDNVAVGRMATQYLLEHGHRRIGFVTMVTGYEHYNWSLNRFRGYRQALEDWGVGFREDYVSPILTSKDRSWKRFEHFLEMDPQVRPTALFCMEDESAVDGIRYMQERGLKVPDDLSFIGVNDLPEDAITGPGLTTIWQPLDQVGSQSMRIVHKMVRGEVGRDHRELLPVKLIERGSVRAV